MRVGWILKKSQEFFRLGNPPEPSSISSQPRNRESATRVGDAGLRCRAREGCLRGRPPCTGGNRPPRWLVQHRQSLVQVSDRAKSTPWLAQAVARCRIRICWFSLTNLLSSACPLDEFSGLVRPVQRPTHVRRKICTADFPRQTYFRQRVPLTNFPAWPGQSSVQPVSSPCSLKNLRCRYSPTNLLSSACPLDEFSCLARLVQCLARVRRKICTADFPRRTPSCTNLRCHRPIVWTNSLFRQALDCKSSRLIARTCCRLCRFHRRCRFQHYAHRG